MLGSARHKSCPRTLIGLRACPLAGELDDAVKRCLMLLFACTPVPAPRTASTNTTVRRPAEILNRAQRAGTREGEDNRHCDPPSRNILASCGHGEQSDQAEQIHRFPRSKLTLRNVAHVPCAEICHKSVPSRRSDYRDDDSCTMPSTS